MPEHIKYAVFYGTFVAMLLLYGVLIGGFWGGYSDISADTVFFIASSAPYITSDLSLLGEVTPPALGFAMASTIPNNQGVWGVIVSFALALLCYVLYLHLSVFFGSSASDVLIEMAGEPLETTKNILLSFSGGVRTFSAVVGAAVVGLKINELGRR